MSRPKHPLPQGVLLAAEYRQPGASLKTLAVKYGCSASTVRNRLQSWATGAGESWPLKSDSQTRGKNRDTVSTAMVVKEIQYACVRLHVTQSTLARLAGINPNSMHKISSVKNTARIMRSTQGKILEAISAVEAGEVVHEPQKVILPMPVRTHCPAGHPYTGASDPTTGRKLCRLCRMDKERRRSALALQRKAVKA